MHLPGIKGLQVFIDHFQTGKLAKYFGKLKVTKIFPSNSNKGGVCILAYAHTQLQEVVKQITK